MAITLQELHRQVAELPSEEKGKISDGYHTFNELYKHRICLFLALCECVHYWVWRSKKHSDGTPTPDGWFIAGIGEVAGKQITYHLPNEYWDKMPKFIKTKKKAPK